MFHTWGSVVFIHWPYPIDVVQDLLPPGLTVDQHAGWAWVGLIPFLLTIRLPGVPVPPVAGVPEINVRTYVLGPDGERGILFLSLDVGSLVTALGARFSYRLPYMWSATRFDVAGEKVRFESRRLWQRQQAADAEIEVVVGERIPEADLIPLDHFLTSRWRLFTRFGRGLAAARVEHPRWVLHRARLVELWEGLVAATGLPPPAGAPHVLYSPGTEARFGLSGRVGAARRAGYTAIAPTLP